MAVVASSSFSSSMIPSTLCNCEAFISFRGDTRKKFVSHLYDALCGRQVRTYRDDQSLEKGSEILPSLYRAIEESKICIVVFSKEYASSRWTLSELVHIIKCKKERGLVVLPIFYDVDPRVVRRQSGSYADAFAKHEEQFGESTVKEWKEALAAAADLSGFHLQHEYESNFIEMIVEDVLGRLNRWPLSVTLDIKGLFGMGKGIEEIECFGLGKGRLIGLWGNGSMSKTAFSHAAVGIENVSMTHGEANLLSQLLEGSHIETLNNRIHRKMALVVLADPSGSTHQESVTHERQIRFASGKPKIEGVSLIELFTPEQVREHIRGLRQWATQNKAKADKNEALVQPVSETSCQLCGVDELTFEPPVLYCTPCHACIEPHTTYYFLGAGVTQHYFCIPCYTVAHGDTIVVDGANIPKAAVDEKRNDEELEEWWLQCDKCKAWQHHICALFNCRRHENKEVGYTCPNCYIQEIEQGELKPLPQTSVLGAKDLPKTMLSDHIEQRLLKTLKHEREQRAKIQGKSYDQVLGAEALVVRVVSSVDKILEVDQRFREIFEEENYPAEYPYKSKAILLFQKIEGVEVCLFSMYAQEFGSEAQFPNRRCVYLSHLDSVKYFRPEIQAVTGVALHTFVYHEILIGYLEYCKKRGFTSCYIWACPALNDEDFILYRHPEFGKTPKYDDLLEWYLSMLRKAVVENIVVDLTNLYDQFFVSAGERKAKITAARLPYFDGDYWSGAAQDLICQLHQEEDGGKQNDKGTITTKTVRKRALESTGNNSKDLLLMHKLGEMICQMKEAFIVVHLQHACSHCCILMVSGSRWVCDQCKSFEICDKCYEAEQRREERERHPINRRKKHTLHPMEIINVPVDTKDEDQIVESEFFSTRWAFLSLCRGCRYDFGTLRRAKYSSMMVLYHLHNPSAPAFLTFCNICHLEIEAGEVWLCEVCTNYNVCDACYQKDKNSGHPHTLKNQSSSDLVQRAVQMRLQQPRRTLDLVVHTSQCQYPRCQYESCLKMKEIFRHAISCKTRASGGCKFCKQMWYFLVLHARECKESTCLVPRCRDLKHLIGRLEKQSDSRRRAAVMEMMRGTVRSSVSTNEEDTPSGGAA